MVLVVTGQGMLVGSLVHGFGQIRMALEAVQLHGSIDVTGAAEVVRTVDASDLTVFVRLNVTLKTLVQAVFLGSDTTTQCVITLMQQELHMVLAHDIIGFDTGVTFWLRHLIRQEIEISCLGGEWQGQKPCHD